MPASTQISSRSSASPDRELALGDAVLQKDVRQVHAEVGGADAHRDLDSRRLIELDHDEQVERGKSEQHHRRDHPEEQERDVGRLAAEAGLHEFFARSFLGQPLSQVEALDHPGHVLLGRLAKVDLLLLAAGKPLAFALADFLALDRNRLHAVGQRIWRQQRHRQREHRRHPGDRGKQHGQELRVVEFGDNEFDHDPCSEVEVDHLLHDEHAD
jgi:hypothetical protein